MARANGRDTLLGFLLDLGLNPRLVNLGNEDEFHRLEEHLALKPGTLVSRRMAVGASRCIDYGEDRFTRFHLLRGKLRICPKCLVEDELASDRMVGTRRYGRTIWMFQSVQCCLEHRCALKEFEVGQSPRVTDFQWALDRYDRERAAKEDVVDMEPTNFEKFIRDRLDGTRTHGDLLDSVSLTAAIDLCKSFGMALAFGAKSARNAPAEDVRLGSDEGFRMLGQGEAGLTGALDKLAEGPIIAANRGPWAIFGEPYRMLNRSRRGDEFERAKALVREYTLNHALISPDAQVFGNKEQHKWTTPRRIGTQLGMPTETIQSYLRGRELAENITLFGESSFIDASVGDITIETLADTTVLPGLCDVLKWTEKECRGLVKIGVLQPKVPSLPNAFRARFSFADAMALKNELLARCGEEEPGMLPVSMAASHLRTQASEILRLVFSSVLAKLAYREGGTLHRSLRVDCGEVHDLITSARRG